MYCNGSYLLVNVILLSNIMLHTHGVAGPIPVAPTTSQTSVAVRLRGFFYLSKYCPISLPITQLMPIFIYKCIGGRFVIFRYMGIHSQYNRQSLVSGDCL